MKTKAQRARENDGMKGLIIRAKNGTELETFLMQTRWVITSENFLEASHVWRAPFTRNGRTLILIGPYSGRSGAVYSVRSDDDEFLVELAMRFEVMS